MNQFREILLKYIPETSVEYIMDQLQSNKVHLRIARKRNTKQGDFRPAHNGQPHRISVNHDLNSYAFLITLVHEIAHLYVFEKHGRKAKPHGIEWKTSFSELMQPLLKPEVFPEDVLTVLKKYLRNASASSIADIELSRILKQYDIHSSQSVLEDIPFETPFRLMNGKRFIKIEKRRKRYLCQSLENSRKYLIHPLAEVIPLESPSKD